MHWEKRVGSRRFCENDAQCPDETVGQPWFKKRIKASSLLDLVSRLWLVVAKVAPRFPTLQSKEEVFSILTYWTTLYILCHDVKNGILVLDVAGRVGDSSRPWHCASWLVSSCYT